MMLRSRDLVSLAFGALSSYRLRSALSMLGIGIGIAAVILLTSIGEGTRRYVLEQFTQFGTNILSINPGKTQTLGIPGVLGGTTHKLTIDDAEAIRRVEGVEDLVPMAMGQARVEAEGRGRSVPIYGTTSSLPRVLKFEVRQGSFLPHGDPRRGAAVAVLGPTLKRELFGDSNPLGRFVRIAGTRLRVIGVMTPKGQMLGFDIDDAAYVPVSTAMKIFNLDELFEIDVLFSHANLTDQVADAVRRLLTARHSRTEDFTITKQTDMLAVFGNVMNVITIAVGAIAGISLLVGAIGILTIMWIAVGERTQEIGLLRALGATPAQVHLVFLAEAAALSTVGGAAGLATGIGLAALLRSWLPGLPVHVPAEFAVAALVVSLITGLASGILPARRAAALDPIEALRAE
ncbi:MAG: ABC transporter permease [Acidobacteriota bacterium]